MFLSDFYSSTLKKLPFRHLRMVSDGDPALLLVGNRTVRHNKVDESLEVVLPHLAALDPSRKVQGPTSSVGKEAWQGHRVEGLRVELAPEGRVCRTMFEKGSDSGEC